MLERYVLEEIEYFWVQGRVTLDKRGNLVISERFVLCLDLALRDAEKLQVTRGVLCVVGVVL